MTDERKTYPADHPYHLRNVPEVELFSRMDFTEFNKKHFSDFADARIEGYSRVVALRMCFGSQFVFGNETAAYCYAIEANAFYRHEYDKKVKSLDLKKAWNPNVSMVALKQLIRDEFVKDNVRMAAIKEANVLAEVTFIDDKGNTRATRGIDDFYADRTTDNQSDDGAGIPEHTPPVGAQTTH